jgi:outer membrane protein assembly factor BamB
MKRIRLLYWTLALLALLCATACSAPRIVWDFETGDDIESDPLVVDGTVYFGSLDRYMYALDTKSGHLRWKFRAEQMIFSPPVVGNGTVYFGDSDGYFYALNAQTGAQIWRTDVGPKSGIYSRSRPAIAAGRVYFEASHDFPKSVFVVHALDAATGQEEWQHPGAGPAVSDGVLYFGDETSFYAWDPQSERERWRFQTDSRAASSSITSSGLVYFGDDDGFVYAVDVRTGEQRWKFKTRESLIYTPAVTEGTIYIGSSDGTLYALNAETGKEQWRFTKKEDINRPAVRDGIVYVTSREGYLYALDAKIGEEKWSTRSRLRLTEAWTIGPYRTHSSPAVDGMVYFGSEDDYLYAVKMD